MGWAFGFTSKQAALAAELKGWTLVAGPVWKGNTGWVVGTYDERPPIIICALAEKDGDWGVKLLCEESHPFFYDVPPAFLDKAPETSPAWRANVRKVRENAATAAALVATLKPGARIVLTDDYGGEPFTVVSVDKGKVLATALSGKLFRIRPLAVARVL